MDDVNAGFQAYYSKTGDLFVRDGIVVQARTGTVRKSSTGVGLASPSAVRPHEETTAARAAMGRTSVGGSGRNLVVSGVPSLAGFYAPSIPGEYELGALKIGVSGASAATLVDGVDTIAILSSGTAPYGLYASTAYGAATYGSSSEFVVTVAAESALGGAIPAAFISGAPGLVRAGMYEAADALNYTSSEDAAWTIEIAPDGTAELAHNGVTVAARGVGSRYDPAGIYTSTTAGAALNPLSPETAADAGGVRPSSNPFSVLTVIYSWAGSPDLDTRTEFLGGVVGFGYATSAPYMTYSGDETSSGGTETVTIDLAQAWEDGVIDTYADIFCAADWFPSGGGSGPAEFAALVAGGEVLNLSILPSVGTPAATQVSAVRVTASGLSALVEPWTVVVQRVGRAPRPGYIFVAVTEVDGVLESVSHPQFATTIPVAPDHTLHYPIAYCDGTEVEQFHIGPLQIDTQGASGTGATGLPLVSLTAAAYDALTPKDADTIYDIIDAPWEP